MFGEVEAETPGRVRSNWEAIKREQEGRSGIFHDVPESLPSLLLARKVQRRVAAIDFEYPDVDSALADLEDELRELKDAIAAAGGEPAAETDADPHVFEELGDMLFAAVNVSRRVNVDPELALRAASKRFRERVERAQESAAAAGESFVELSLERKDAYFDNAKEELR